MKMVDFFFDVATGQTMRAQCETINPANGKRCLLEVHSPTVTRHFDPAGFHYEVA